MKGKVGKRPHSTDLLVCFPTRAHLTLMPPKPICSPARPLPESSKGQPSHHHHHRHHRRKRSMRAGQGGSPVLWGKNKTISSDISEPTSPKVTCAGQIKVRPKPNSCKNWESVMEEIERLHNGKKHKRSAAWAKTLGFRKDVMQFLTCLRNIRFDFRCFGAFPTTEISSEEEEEEEDDYKENFVGKQVDCEEETESSTTVFSKWFMVLQEDYNNSKKKNGIGSHDKSSSDEIIAPPSNALLLMRCRSAPAKSWLEEREEEEKVNGHDEKEKMADEDKAMGVKDEEVEKNENLVLRYGAENHFCKVSADIAKETWIVGGIRESLSRSRSWKI